MDDRPPDDRKDADAWKAWLTRDMTVTFPRWMYLAAGGVALILLLVALD